MADSNRSPGMTWVEAAQSASDPGIVGGMKGVLVRVGIDQASGGWNAPVAPRTGAFVYVPIPDHRAS